MSGEVFGIDLGTTYSAVAKINDLGQAEIIKNQNGEDITPSVVYFDSGVAIVGAEAKSSLVSEPDSGCALIKRKMGTVFPQEFGGQTFTPESLSGLILKELVNAANREGASAVTKAVVTVPAYFGVKEKEATKQAAEMAGLEVVGILAEPIAAALSLGVRGEKRETILVYDLGGGTFDTTVMIAEPGNIEVVAVDGNRVLGGADWDKALTRVVIDKFVAQAGITDADPGDDPDFIVEINQDAEVKKKLLTRKQDTVFRCRFDGFDEKITVTRDEFVAATAHLVQQTVSITQRVIETAKAKSPGLSIDKLMLVGGSSRMPMVDEALRRAGFDPIPTDYDLSVAKGAAIYGQAILSGSVWFKVDGASSNGAENAPVPTGATSKYLPGPATTLNIKNVLSRGIGVEFVREGSSGGLEPYVGFLVHANDSLPVVDTKQEAGTAVDNQTGVRLKIYEQGGEVESDDISANNLLAEKEITGLPPMPRGSTIELLVNISHEGLATLRAREPISGKELNIEAKIAVLTREEVEAWTKVVEGLITRS